MSKLDEASESSPLRRLYATLVAVDSESGIHENLAAQHSDYATMAGDPEPRFREWAYHQLEKRTLISSLLGSVLRPSDARRLALNCGFKDRDLDGLAPLTILREALRTLGVNEPAVPGPARDGVAELQRCLSALNDAIKDTQAASLEDTNADIRHPSSEICRRGTERLLKVLCFFLWDSGFDEVIRRVVTGGLHEFEATPPEDNDWEGWLHKRDLGQFNYLLNAINEEILLTSHRVPFLVAEQKVWSSAAFQAIDSLTVALQGQVHDLQTTIRYEPDSRRRMQKLFNALEKVLARIVGARPPIWRPRTIQFFRRMEDGHSIHHEGYDDKGELVRFFESPQRYDLHVPHVFVAATNPSAIDVSCTKLRQEFTRSV